MEEEIRELAAVYAKMAENLTARWPNGIEKLNGKDYRPAVSDLAIAGTLEMVAKDLQKVLDRHMDDRK